MTSEIIARRLNVNGIVQGVGFRPFVFQLARNHKLTGTVSNTASGVDIHVEGCPADIDSFMEDLATRHPPLAHIVEMTHLPSAVTGAVEMTIAASRAGSARATLISPDVSVCRDCLNEMMDPKDRRFGYPFTNCTNCGPRYTIIDDIPYDRLKTSMRHFVMCDHCQSEYDNPRDRRFHAQPNACPVCGPHVSLHDAGGRKLPGEDPIGRTAELIKAGHILAVKGLGGFHLVVDAENDEAVARLRERKHREEKPLAVMALDLDHVRRFARVSPEEATLLSGIQRPIVLLKKREHAILSGRISPRNHYYGVMLPYTPLHYLLLAHDFTALVMTSGNLSEEPIAIGNGEAFGRLGRIADFFLVHNRDIYLRSDDSIVRVSSGSTRFIRRSRGYVPIPVFLKRPLPRIIACGAELKNTVCLTRDRQAFLSQHIGDLENLATEDFYGMTIDHLKRILDIKPAIIACDLHPDYASTRYARGQRGMTLVEVQHHHAHIVSCMAENKVDGRVIGLAFDGTGYGPDGAVWGGEVLIADAGDFTRAAYLRYVAMPGSSAAIREPWRMAVAYLLDTFGESGLDIDLPVLRTIDPQKVRILAGIIRKKINSPLTSSLGRLFDGVAAILGIRFAVAYEGQAAMELEMAADESVTDAYAVAIDIGDPYLIPVAPIIKGVVEDIRQHVPVAIISARFHQTLVNVFTDVCVRLRADTGLDQVALSGGVFQNSMLLGRMVNSLDTGGFTVHTHKSVPTNDAGISLGQAVIAAAKVDEEKNIGI
ncbi:MAG: carbamoyltransferase HypF [Desulfobacteraceae bacterium]|nr:carbamoyltransferase HypF [Desulfobacteraceae bacterium]